MKKSNGSAAKYLGEENEFLIHYAKNYPQRDNIDYFIFGHRHIMLDMMIPDNKRVIILGDWINHFSFAVFDGEHLYLEQLIDSVCQV